MSRSNIRFLLAACASLALVCPAFSQGVYKCAEGGKTVYQAEPCAGQGKTLTLQSGPTAEQAQEARRRADAEKSRASAIVPPARSTPAVSDASAGAAPKANCDALNRQRADAFGRRNAGIRGSRTSGFDNSGYVDRATQDIMAIESQMKAAGCTPN